MREEAERIGSIRQLAAEYQTLTADQLEREHLPVLARLELIDPDSPDSPYLGSVLANLRRLDVIGASIPETVTKLLSERELGDARDVRAVLHYRLASHLEDRSEIGRYVPLGVVLAEEGINPGGPGGKRAALRPYRALTAIEESGGDIRAALRDAMEHVDQSLTRNIPARLTQLLAETHGLSPLQLQEPPEAVRASLRGDLVAGLIERAPDFGDPDVTQALKDRELAIQLRAELLVDRAIDESEAWIEGMGEPLPGEESRWRKRAVTVACFRDLYGIDSDEPLGSVHAHARNRERDRQIAAAAYGDRAEVRFESARPSLQPQHEVNQAQRPTLLS